MIVVGDEMQLPPTSFFAAARDDEDDDEVEPRATRSSRSTLDADSFLNQRRAQPPAHHARLALPQPVTSR